MEPMKNEKTGEPDLQIYLNYSQQKKEKKVGVELNKR